VDFVQLVLETYFVSGDCVHAWKACEGRNKVGKRKFSPLGRFCSEFLVCGVRLVVYEWNCSRYGDLCGKKTRKSANDMEIEERHKRMYMQNKYILYIFSNSFINFILLI